MPEPSQPRVGVGVLLLDNHGRVLLTLRKRPPEAGCWSIVGGKVDFLETLEQCAIRKRAKKLAWRSLFAPCFASPTTACPAKTSTGFPPAYLGQILSGEATNCEPARTRQVRWFELDRLPPNLTMTAHNAIRAYSQRREGAA